jgi:hypothetical protein
VEEPLSEGEALPIEESTLPPEPEPERWVVRVDTDPCLVLRFNPFPEGARLDCLLPGTEVRPIERAGVWWRVALEDGRTGWVAGSYLNPVR